MSSQNDADRIRLHTFERYLRPEREKGVPLVIVRAGDVAEDLGLGGYLPKVCGALGATLFETEFRVRRVYLHGPTNGANTYFIYDVSPAV